MTQAPEKPSLPNPKENQMSQDFMAQNAAQQINVADAPLGTIPQDEMADRKLRREIEEETYATERAAARQERYYLQNIVNRQTALHAALMLEPKPQKADALIAAAEPILAFLTAK